MDRFRWGKEKFQKQSCPSGNKKNSESFWVKLKLKTIILSRNVVNINNKISHGKCNSRQYLPTTRWNCQRFKQEKNCDSELFCTNSLSLHLGRIKMSLSKLKFKGRVIWTEKCGLTFHFFLYRLSYLRAQQTHRGRPLAMLAYRKNRAKETSFLRQKIDQKRSWMETLTSRKIFCDVFLWKQQPWKKDFEFVFFSVMAAVSFWVSFTGEINNLTINNYEACQT